MTALSDTGSTHTLIDKKVYDKIPHLSPLYPAPRVQPLIRNLPLKGACTLKIAGKPYEVLVCKNLGVDVLLGMNVLLRSILDFHNNVLILGGQKIPLDTTPETSMLYDILSAKRRQ